MLHCAHGDLCGASAPAGVDGSDNAVHRVGDKNREAVGGFDRNALTGCVRKQRVGFQTIVPLAAFDHTIGMNLFQLNPIAGRTNLGRAEAVFEPRFPV
jgi:hypothetical protein